jgi:hypothetical protein
VFLIIRGRGIAKGIASGEILVSEVPIAFLSGVDPDTGVIIEQGHPLRGTCIAGRVLAFEHGKGSTVGSYVLYALSRNGHAPAAIINGEAEPIIVVGAIISGIPMIDRLEVPITVLRTGTRATVNGDTGELDYEGNLA